MVRSHIDYEREVLPRPLPLADALEEIILRDYTSLDTPTTRVREGSRDTREGRSQRGCKGYGIASEVIARASLIDSRWIN